tara:strand:- start:2993 stop:3604 length:612 start_codon:yes stop_codon:yes gene_type:complete
MDYRIVVSKYKENVQWVNEFDNSKVIVYDKSDNPIKGSISIPNIGRETETFFRYIVDNYENLPDYVVFLQGNPFDHYKTSKYGFLKDYILKKILEQPTERVPIGNMRKNRRNLLGLNLHNYYEFLFNKKSPRKFYYNIGAQNIVPKEIILKRSKEFWENNITMLKNNYEKRLEKDECFFKEVKFDKTLINPWTCEVLMPYIFS